MLGSLPACYTARPSTHRSQMTDDDWARRAVRELLRACRLKIEAELARHRRMLDRWLRKG